MEGRIVVEIIEEYDEDIACLEMKTEEEVAAALFGILKEAVSSTKSVKVISYRLEEIG